MENNFPSEKRNINDAPPQVSNNFQPIGVSINQQGYPTQQGYPMQQGYPVQQGFQAQQGYVVQQGYGQPLTNYQNPNIIPIQTVPTVVVNAPTKFTKSPMSLVCPRCKASITTNIQEEFNWSAFCLCCFTCFVIFACIQCCNGKDLGCTDVKHFCPNCGQMVGGYVAI